MANDANIALPFLAVNAGTPAIVEIALPALTVEAYVYSGLEDADIVLPFLGVEGLTGATAELRLSVLTVSGTSISGVIANAYLRLPRLTTYTVTASPILAAGDVELPGLFVSASSIHNVLANGDITLVSLSAGGLTSLSEDIIGYAINPKSMGLSIYEGYDFNSLCVISGKSFGASSSGLYLLEGSTDAGKMIESEIEFPLTDFEISNEKRARSVYYGGNADGQLRLSVSGNEGEERRRLFRPKVVKGKTVVPVGRNVKEEYWQFRLENVRGADFELDTLEVYLVVLRRGGCVGC